MGSTEYRVEQEIDMERGKVYEAIDSERDHQDYKWGSVERHPHEVGAYLTLMRKLLRDAEDAWASTAGDYKALLELRKLLAVGVACAEQHGLTIRSRSHTARESMRHPLQGGS